MEEDIVHEVVGGGTWIFLGNLLISLTNFVFWLVIARFVGVEALGISSVIVSCSGLAATLISAGLGIAIIREVALKELESLVASIILALVMGLIAALLAAFFAGSLGYSNLIVIAFLLSLANIVSSSFLFGLIGLEMFREYFTASFVGSLAKLFVGIVLAFAGFRILAPLMGYLTYPIIVVIIAAALIVKTTKTDDVRLNLNSLNSLIFLTYSNYPYTFSNQLLSMLSIYIFAFLIGGTLSTGSLYITLTLALAISAIPSSILNASLSIGTKRNVDPFLEGYRIGLGLVTPMIVVGLAAPTSIFQAINPELVRGVNALRIMLLSLTPLTTLDMVIFKLNKSGQKKKLTLIGLGRLSILVALLALLTRFMGMNGVAVAFLIANATLIPSALIIEPNIGRLLTCLWSIHGAIAFFAIITPINEAAKAIIALLVSIAVMHFLKIFTFNDYQNILRIMLNKKI